MDRSPADSLPPEEVRGRITVHQRGFGFLRVESGEDGSALSAFVAPPDLNGFLSDDLCAARLTTGADGRFTASGLALLSRPRGQLFGEVVHRRGSPFLRIDREISNTDWPLDLSHPDGNPGGNDVRDDLSTDAGRAGPAPVQVPAGTYVVARIAGQTAVLSRIIGPGADLALEQVIARHGLLEDFAPAVLAEAQAQAHRAHDATGRADLREVPTVTVDSVSTRDIDDAVAVLPAGSDGALRLLVSIADVSEFVRGGSVLDNAARERGTSVYLAGRVLPMLPDNLSADWLSLLPGADRHCLTVELRVDPEGRITAVDLYQSVIRSWARLNYSEVAAFLDHGQLSPAMEPVRAMMPWLRTAQSRLSVSRARRGGVRIAQDETRIVFDSAQRSAAPSIDTQGQPTGAESAQPTSAHAMIEHFMVAANEAVAGWLADRGVPAVYRVHDAPDEASVADLQAAARRLGIEAGFGKKLSPLALLAFDTQISGGPAEFALRAVLRRSLGPARYTSMPSPHFGLAAPLYLHFTSPIRRYADLQVHRLIKRYLHGQRTFADEGPLLPLCEHLNRRASSAGRAENDRRRVLLARLLSSSGLVGEVYTARITRIRPFGLVLLAQMMQSTQATPMTVEGTLPADALPDGPYKPDPRETELIGRQRTFALGLELRVRLTSADPVLGRIEFALAED